MIFLMLFLALSPYNMKRHIPKVQNISGHYTTTNQTIYFNIDYKQHPDGANPNICAIVIEMPYSAMMQEPLFYGLNRDWKDVQGNVKSKPKHFWANSKDAKTFNTQKEAEDYVEANICQYKEIEGKP